MPLLEMLGPFVIAINNWVALLYDRPAPSDDHLKCILIDPYETRRIVDSSIETQY